MAAAWHPTSISSCLKCGSAWGEVAYRAAGLCCTCAKAERRAGRIDGWVTKWKARQRRPAGRVDDWYGLLQRVLRYLPGSTIEDELGLAEGTVAAWVRTRSVPFERRDDLRELARRAPRWRWTG